MTSSDPKPLFKTLFIIDTLMHNSGLLKKISLSFGQLLWVKRWLDPGAEWEQSFYRSKAVQGDLRKSDSCKETRNKENVQEKRLTAEGFENYRVTIW